jgi:YVTN family beta-propeller protein
VIANVIADDFSSADLNRDGSVSQEEFQRFLNHQSNPKSTAPNNRNESKNDFALADKNRDGIVTPQEFNHFLLSVSSPPPTMEETTRRNFDAADKNRDGFVSAEELALYRKKESAGTSRNIRATIPQNQPKNFEYKGPMKMVASPDGTKIYTALHDSGEIAVIDSEKNIVIKIIPVGNEPEGIALSSDGKVIYVTFGGSQGTLSALDAESGQILQSVAAGHTPTSPVLTPDGTKIFVCNRFNNNVTEYNLPELKFVRQIEMIREPRSAVVTNDGTKILVLNFLPNNVNCYPDNPETKINVAAEVSMIDVATGATKNIQLPNGSCNLFNICLSSDGRYAYLTHLISHFWNSTDKLDAGQMNVNAMSIIDTSKLDDEHNGYVNTVLLDDPERGAANPCGIATSADGKQIYVAISGTNELIILDADALHAKLASIDVTKSSDVSSDLTFTGDLKKRIPFKGKGARELLVTGGSIYLGLYFNDLIVKYNPNENSEPVIIPFGNTLMLSQERLGEIAWNDASLCYQQWQTCASCHPDGRMTGVNWDLLHDGSGNPKNTKSMVYSYYTPPTMWLGDRFTVRQCTRTGFQFIMFTPPQDEPCDGIDIYVQYLKPLPSPYLVDGKLSAKAERGKILFESPAVGCVHCHSGEYFTDRKMYDVQTKIPSYERRGRFDTPTLNEVWRTAPYLHDGRYVNMKDVFTKGNHGNVKNLNNEEIDDLVEYVLSL